MVSSRLGPGLETALEPLPWPAAGAVLWLSLSCTNTTEHVAQERHSKARWRRHTAPRSPWSACCFGLLHQTYFHFLWPLLLTGQGWVKGGSVAWHLLKRELKSPSRWEYLLCTGWWLWSLPELGTMGNEGERRSLTALFHSWKVGLRERKSIYLIAHRELQTVGMRIIQGFWV